MPFWMSSVEVPWSVHRKVQRAGPPKIGRGKKEFFWGRWQSSRGKEQRAFWLICFDTQINDFRGSTYLKIYPNNKLSAHIIMQNIRTIVTNQLQLWHIIFWRISDMHVIDIHNVCGYIAPRSRDLDFYRKSRHEPILPWSVDNSNKPWTGWRITLCSSF